MSQIDTISLGKTSVKVSRLGIGVMIWGEPKGLFGRFNPAQFAYGGIKSREVEKKAFDTAIEKGINFFDTAAMYSNGGSELRLGELAENKNVIIATKFPPGFFTRTKALEKSLDNSLKRLKRVKIDLYQHHYPTKWISIKQLMNKMADAAEEGKIDAIGVSNYSKEQMEEAYEVLEKRNIPLASNQIQYSLLNRKPEFDGTIDMCKELGVSLIAYQPLASGALTGKYTIRKPNGFRKRTKFFSKKNQKYILEVLDILQRIGENHNKSKSQVALRWLLENPPVIPIPGVRDENQVLSNLGALQFELSKTEYEELNEASTYWLNN